MDGGLIVTDTLTLRTATVLLDSVVTQQAEHLLVGAYLDPEIGRVEARGYVPLALGDGFSPPKAAVFDSLTLNLELAYGYGALDAPHTLRVHRATEPIEPEDEEDALTSPETFTFDPAPLGSISFTPEDESTVSVRLDDELGATLFDAAKNDDPLLTDDDVFEAFLRGLVVVSESETAVLGFEAFSADSAFVGLHLHYREAPTSDAAPRLYVFEPTTRTFSNIRNERPALLVGLDETRGELATARTGETGYVAGGTGLALRVEVPTAYRLLFEEQRSTTINGASLYLFPVRNTYDDETPLPRSLDLYVADEDNERLEPLLNKEEEPVTSSAEVDVEFGRATYYAFDVTRFIEQEIEAGFDTERGLLIRPTAFANVNTVDRVAFGGGGPGEYQAVLQIVYTRF